MHFLTTDECRQWVEGHGIPSSQGRPSRPSTQACYASGPLSPTMGFCRHFEHALQPRESCLLWVTEWGVWPSHENLHLYYRLRQSYGDQRQIYDAPGHLFLNYEAADLVSFMQIGILCGWDIHLLPAVGFARAFLSHDEYVEFAGNESNRDLAKTYATGLKGCQIYPQTAAA